MNPTLFLFLFCIACSLQIKGAKLQKLPVDTLPATQIIELIKKNVTCDWDEKTVDTFKTGNPDDKVSGVVSCMFADMKILKEAVANNCNLIITHEPTFYNHLDETGYLKDDPVFNDKMKYIRDNRLIIWRFHDHWHRTNPDGIYVGMINKLGWNNFKNGNSQKFFLLKEQTITELCNHLKETFNTNALRVIGDPEMKLTKVALAVGALGSRTHIQLLQDNRTEVLIAGESPEWETYEYVLDAVNQDKKKAVIFLGHINSEEAGMDYFAQWLQTFVKDIPVIYLQNGQPYWTPN